MKDTGQASGAEELLQFLKQPESYPHQPEKVKHLQTHISHVFIAPPYVFKMKKPVDFGFLDYSTLEKRKHLCEREVELNCRLCSDIYLGVVPISKNDNDFILDERDEGEIVEYAVKMKKLEDKYFLHAFIANGSLTNEHLDRVIKKLADFYKTQASDESMLEFGSIDHIRYNTDENFEQTEKFIDDTIAAASYHAIRYFTNRYFEAKKSLFQQRIEERRIVDGHGDLHLEHIYVTPKTVCIYDCIEFNERFRKGDVAADLAFFSMDLDFNDCRKEGRYFIDQMADALDDPDLPEITDFYKCYRAYVKGKVKSLQSDEEELEKKKRGEARQKASRYFKLALRYAVLGSRPWVLIFMGRIATGKSMLAKQLEKQMDISRFSSDEVRKSLSGLPRNGRSPKQKREQLYGSQMSKKTYETLLEKVGSYAKDGKNIIVDATFSSREVRERFITKLESQDAHYLFIEVTASDDEIKSRLKKREKKPGVISDARFEDFDKLNKRYETPEELDKSKHIIINTRDNLSETIKELYQKMIELQLEKGKLPD